MKLAPARQRQPASARPLPSALSLSGRVATNSAPLVLAPQSPRVTLPVRLAFYLFVFSIPFEMPNRSIPVEITTITGAVFVLTTLFSAGVAYRWIPKALWWFVAYLWFFGLSTLFNHSEHLGEVAALFVNMVELVLIWWAGSNILRDPRVMRATLLTIAFACLIRGLMQILGIAAHEHAEWTGGFRVTVLGQNPNWSAIVLSVGFVAVLNLRNKLVAWPAAAVIGLALVQTGSRGGLFCAAAGTVLLLWHGKTLGARLRGVALAFVALLGLAITAYETPMLRVRFEAALEEGSYAGRENIYPAVLSMIRERPFLGWGPVENQYEIAHRIEEERLDRRDAHNILFELFSTTGMFGAIPFLIGLAICVREAWRARKSRWQMLPFAILVAVLVGCLSGTWIASKVLWFTFAIAVGAAAYVRQDTQQGSGPTCAV
jgi:O-antigen ligase